MIRLLSILFWAVLGLQLLALGAMLFLALASGPATAVNGDVAGGIMTDLVPPMLWLGLAAVVYFIRRTLAWRVLALVMAVAPLVYIALPTSGGVMVQEFDPKTGRVVRERPLEETPPSNAS
jgi:hypothetical protein